MLHSSEFKRQFHTNWFSTEKYVEGLVPAKFPAAASTLLWLSMSQRRGQTGESLGYVWFVEVSDGSTGTRLQLGENFFFLFNIL